MLFFVIGFVAGFFTDEIPLELWIGLSFVEGIIELILAVAVELAR